MDQAFYRAAKAAFSLELLTEAFSFCQRGLEQQPSNEELKKLQAQIKRRKKDCENHKAQVSNAVVEAKVSYLMEAKVTFRYQDFVVFFSQY